MIRNVHGMILNAARSAVSGGAVSCASAGNCGAGGEYAIRDHLQAFVVSRN